MKKLNFRFLFGAVVTVIFIHLTLRIYRFHEDTVADENTVELSSNNAFEESLVIMEKHHPECKENPLIQNFPDFYKQPPNMKDFLTYHHCKSFPQLLDSPMKCGEPSKSEKVFLLLAIKSSPANYEHREAVRKTWGAEKTFNGVNIKRIFLSGIPKPEREGKRIMQLLNIESQMYNDVLQWEFYDTFYNLTLKQVLFLTWLEANCPGAQFIFSGDDDVFVNIKNVVIYLKGQGKAGSKQHHFVGALNIGMPPVREPYSKYYVPQQLFNETSFVPYCGGGGIIMSGFTACSIFKASQNIPLFPIDDAYLGMCLKKAGLKPENHEGIRTFGIQLPAVDSFDPCYHREMLVVHRFVPYEMLVMWKFLQLTELNCTKKSSGKPPK